MIFKSTKQELIYTFINGIEINKVSRGYARWMMIFSRVKFAVLQQIIGHLYNIIQAGDSGGRLILPLKNCIVRGVGRNKKGAVSKGAVPFSLVLNFHGLKTGYLVLIKKGDASPFRNFKSINLKYAKSYFKGSF